MSETNANLSPLEVEKRNQLKTNKPLVHKKVLKYEEKFRKGESIAIIQLQYDYTCNFNCQHCAISDFRKKKWARTLTIEDIHILSQQADEIGLGHIDITGGEPLIFPDLDQLVEALEPEKFYLQIDTNGWGMTDEKAVHLKSLGVDKIQLSLDNLSPKAHDDFRRMPGSHARAIQAMDSIHKAGLNLQLATVVTHQRVRSKEFIEFLEFAEQKNAGVAAIWPKPVGEWSGRTDVLATPEDFAYLEKLRNNYNVYDHISSQYGLDIGCIAVKRMISITKYGDVMPCPWIYYSLGNIFKEPLRDILERGMHYFGKYVDHCLVSGDRTFIDEYMATIHGKDELPVPIETVHTDSFTR